MVRCMLSMSHLSLLGDQLQLGAMPLCFLTNAKLQVRLPKDPVLLRFSQWRQHAVAGLQLQYLLGQQSPHCLAINLHLGVLCKKQMAGKHALSVVGLVAGRLGAGPIERNKP